MSGSPPGELPRRGGYSLIWLKRLRRFLRRSLRLLCLDLFLPVCDLSQHRRLLLEILSRAAGDDPQHHFFEHQSARIGQQRLGSWGILQWPQASETLGGCTCSD